MMIQLATVKNQRHGDMMETSIFLLSNNSYSLLKDVFQAINQYCNLSNQTQWLFGVEMR